MTITPVPYLPVHGEQSAIPGKLDIAIEHLKVGPSDIYSAVEPQ